MENYVRVNGDRYGLRPKWDGSREFELVSTEKLAAHVALPRDEFEELRSILMNVMGDLNRKQLGEETIVLVALPDAARRALEILNCRL